MAATLIGFTASTSVAQTPEELLLLLPPWDTVFTARTGGGYKDNPLLSHARPGGSAFVSGGADAMVLRLTPSPTHFNLFASGDATRYLSGPAAHNEYIAFATAQVEHDFNETWKALLGTEYFYQDQILDVSISETNRQALPVRGHTITLRPGVRLELPRQWWLALEGFSTRQFFAAPLDDYWEAGSKLTLGRTYGWNSHVALSYEPSWRPYDTEPALTATGNAITNETRFGFRQEGRLIWRHHWDEQKHWRSTLTASSRLNEENGGGYFDFTRWGGIAQVRCRTKPWEISVEGRVAYYDYHTQTTSATNPALRRRTDWSAIVRIERELTKHLKVSASYEHEQALSNDPLETYSVNTVGGAVSWEF